MQGKKLVSKTNEAVSNAVESRREKKEEKLTQKIDETRAELKDNGFIDVAPAMITLPEFEEERMAVMAEEHDNTLNTPGFGDDHMHNVVDQSGSTRTELATTCPCNRRACKNCERRNATGGCGFRNDLHSMTSALSFGWSIPCLGDVVNRAEEDAWLPTTHCVFDVKSR